VIITTLLLVAGCSPQAEYNPPLDAVAVTQVATGLEQDHISWQKKINLS